MTPTTPTLRLIRLQQYKAGPMETPRQIAVSLAHVRMSAQVCMPLCGYYWHGLNRAHFRPIGTNLESLSTTVLGVLDDV